MQEDTMEENMPMSIGVTLNLNDVLSSELWETTIGEMVKDELRLLVRGEIRKLVTSNVDLKNAVMRIQKKAVEEIMEAAWNAIPPSAFTNEST